LSTEASPNHYVLGHSDLELARLERQAEIFGAETREVLRSAGLKNGMRVLDVGCGVGDVSMAAAQLVGPTGTVLGIDKAADALRIARKRAQRANYTWLAFDEVDLFAFEAPAKFDAVIGRFILMHIAEPVAALSRFGTLARAGGAVAFIEMDIGQTGAVPPMPLLDRCLRWITATYHHVGVEANMGSKLYAAFRSAGMNPKLAGTTRIESGPDSVAYVFAAETLASLLPAIVEHGIATAEQVGVDTLAHRLRAEAITGDHCIFMPRLIGAWATKPAG
jgi:ubiquinone/menaquinone biosynthesis C-methylase UbiE